MSGRTMDTTKFLLKMVRTGATEIALGKYFCKQFSNCRVGLVSTSNGDIRIISLEFPTIILVDTFCNGWDQLKKYKRTIVFPDQVVNSWGYLGHGDVTQSKHIGTKLYDDLVLIGDRSYYIRSPKSGGDSTADMSTETDMTVNFFMKEFNITLDLGGKVIDFSQARKKFWDRLSSDYPNEIITFDRTTGRMFYGFIQTELPSIPDEILDTLKKGEPSPWNYPTTDHPIGSKFKNYGIETFLFTRSDHPEQTDYLKDLKKWRNAVNYAREMYHSRYTYSTIKDKENNRTYNFDIKTGEIHSEKNNFILSRRGNNLYYAIK